MVLLRKKSWGYKIWTFILVIILSLFMGEKSFSKMLSGVVNKEHIIVESGMIVNERTGKPVAGASVSIPSKGTQTLTDESGKFQINIPDTRPLIMSVNAKGYKPFSLIIDENKMQKPMKIAIAEKTNNELVIDTRLHHLGDNKFSDRSANSGDFSTIASGSSYFKEFYIDNSASQSNIWLKIGSIIGIDTLTAQGMRQSNVLTSSSSPVEVFFNSQKIGEIAFNGNNHILRVPSEILRVNSYNHIRIKTGVNLNSSSRKDYDDIEFMHLVLEFR